MSLKAWSSGSCLRPSVLRGRLALSRNISYRTTFARAAPPLSNAGKVFLAAGALALGGATWYISNGLELVSLDAKSARNVYSRPVTKISFQEVQKHNSKDSLWVIIGGKVYDVTEFIAMHPGGAKPLLANGGKDVTAAYDHIHGGARRYLDSMLPPEKCIGEVDPATLPTKKPIAETEEERRIAQAIASKPKLGAMINLDDFEAVAEAVLPRTAWSYYASSADEGSSHLNNLRSYGRYWFRPRVLRKTASASASSTFLGIPTSLPIFISPAALAGLGHPLGEINLTRAAGKAGIVQGISNNASRSIEEVAEARVPGQPLIFQLYVANDWKKSERDVKKAEALGFQAVMLTVDTTVMGKREKDMRARAGQTDNHDDDTSVAASMGDFYDPNLGWDVIPWLKGISSLPVIIKGVQCVEDVEIALEHGASGVLLSNHGGRQLAYAPASIDVLYELRQRRPDVFDKMEIYIDGGIRRGTDVLKALCLGAKAVGLGRPILYANAAYGEPGVTKAIAIMRDEIVRGMRLLGVTRVEDLRPDMVRFLEGSSLPVTQ